MAYTVTRTPSIAGNERVNTLRISADAATQTVETGFQIVSALEFAPVSMGTAAIKIAYNSNASGIQSMGVLGISGAASGDEFFIRVYGR